MTETNCTDSIAHLYTFLDGELTPEKRVAITEHLDDCGPCLDRFDFEADLRRVVAKCCHQEVPETLRDRIARSIGIEPVDNQ